MGWLDDLLGTQFSLGGTLFPRRQYTNFVSGVTIADNPGANRTDVTFDYDSHGAQVTADGIHTTLWKIYTNATDRRAQALTAADVGKRGLQLDTAKIWDVVPSLATPGTYVWGDNAGPESAGTPLTIITSTSVKLWVDSALGAGANAWNDQSGNANHFAEPTNPPTLTTLGGVLCYQGNGSNMRFRNATLTVTANQWYWIIARPVGWTGSGSICGGRTSAYASILESGSSPEVSIYSGVVGAPNAFGAVGSWSRYKFVAANSGAYLKIGSHNQAGSGGSNTETGWDIFCRAGTAFGNYAIAAIVVCPAEPTPTEQANLDAYGAARWPAVAF